MSDIREIYPIGYIQLLDAIPNSDRTLFPKVYEELYGVSFLSSYGISLTLGRRLPKYFCLTAWKALCFLNVDTLKILEQGRKKK